MLEAGLVSSLLNDAQQVSFQSVQIKGENRCCSFYISLLSDGGGGRGNYFRRRFSSLLSMLNYFLLKGCTRKESLHFHNYSRQTGASCQQNVLRSCHLKFLFVLPRLRRKSCRHGNYLVFLWQMPRPHGLRNVGIPQAHSPMTPKPVVTQYKHTLEVIKC